MKSLKTVVAYLAKNGVHCTKLSKRDIRELDSAIQKVIDRVVLRAHKRAERRVQSELKHTWGSRRFGGAVKLVGSNALKNVRKELRSERK